MFQSPRNGDDLSDGEPLETEERSHTPPPRVDSPEDNLTPQLKVKVSTDLLVFLVDLQPKTVIIRSYKYTS